MRWTGDSLRDLERTSIRQFVEGCAPHLTGRVLDLGCGQQPYRDIVQGAGGIYVGYDRLRFPANVSGADIGDELAPDDHAIFDAVLSTQVIQYVDYPQEWLAKVAQILVPGGVLVLTGPTSWPCTENDDLWRFTSPGARRLLERAGFIVDGEIVYRATVGEEFGADFRLGFGAVARA